MATPKLDDIILQFRRDVADLYDGNGDKITSAATDGKIYTKEEMEDLFERALEELMERVIQGAPSNVSAGKFLAEVFPEYVTHANLSGVQGAFDGTVTYNLPSDFAYLVSAFLDNVRAHEVSRATFDSLIDGRNRERHRAPHVILEGTTIRFVRKNPLPDSSSKGQITYIRRQTVAQNTTDTYLNLRHRANILKLMSIIYHRDLGLQESQ